MPRFKVDFDNGKSTEVEAITGTIAKDKARDQLNLHKNLREAAGKADNVAKVVKVTELGGDEKAGAGNQGRGGRGGASARRDTQSNADRDRARGDETTNTDDDNSGGVV